MKKNWMQIVSLALCAVLLLTVVLQKKNTDALEAELAEQAAVLERQAEQIGELERLLLEEKSTSTAENFVFSKSLLQQAGVDVEDEYLTHDSQKFHLAMGYDYVGKLHKAGYKFGHWYDMITMEKIIGPHPEHTQPDVVPWFALHDEVFKQAEVVK